MSTGFPEVERWILRTSNGVEQIQDLFTNCFFMTKKMVFDNRWVHAVRFQQFPGKKSREQRRYFAAILITFGQEGNIFSICCSSDEYLLYFLKVIITAFFPHFLHRLLNLPRLGRWRKVSRTLNGRLSFKQGKEWPRMFPLQSSMPLILHGFLSKGKCVKSQRPILRNSTI
jgi:hypothetical protein